MKLATALWFCACLPVTAQHHFLGKSKPLTAASSAAPDQIARLYLQSVAAELSLDATALNAVYIAKQYRTEHNDVTHVMFRQRFQGTDVLNAEWVVNLDRDGRVLNAGGMLFNAPEGESVPAMSRALAAVRAAVKSVDPAVDDFAPFASARAARGLKGVRFASGPLPLDVEGAPVWYAVRGKLHPAWNFFVAHSDRVHRYSVTVADRSQTILDQRPLTFFQNPAAPRGMVFERESPQPNPNPGFRIVTPPAVVSRTMQSFKGDPTASPLGWTNGAETAGNNAVVGENENGNDFVRPTPTIAANGDFIFPLQLGPGTSPLDYVDAANSNLFYWINRAHDLHYLYGFDEQSGNYQATNFGRGGVEGDAVYAYSHYGTQLVGGGATQNSFFSLQGSTDDGVQAEVSMYLGAGPGAKGDFFTDGAYDANVIIHEYTHGVSERLARQVYTTFQGRSMGEGWSDFFGIEYVVPEGAPPDGLYGRAYYFYQDWGFDTPRTRPYSTNSELNPLTYANLGHVARAPEVHADGEIWVEALWEVRANLIKQFGDQEGRKRLRHLVLDGMKLAVPAGSMVDHRDGILLADRVDYNGASQNQIWAAFAKRGLGALAYSDGGDTAHVLPSFDLPSATGAIKFYDDPIVIGEPLRIVLEDLNYSQPTARIQLTTTSGDLENVILHQRGSVYVGSVVTRTGNVTRLNSSLEVVPADYIGAYYVDQNTVGPAKLIQTSVSTMPAYAISNLPPAFTFANEQRLTVQAGSFLIFSLPFSFPFYDRKYGTALVYPNGLIAFEYPAASPVCTDFVALRNYVGIAPLWMTMSVTGSAQPNEGLYISSPSSDSITFRWAGEHTPVGGAATPVNFAATLYADGRIEFNYGADNTSALTASGFSQCAPPTYGISNGHDTYSQTITTGSLVNHAMARFDPPFNAKSLPAATITAPRAGTHAQDILVVSGTATDFSGFVTGIDIFVDGQQRARTTPSGSAGAWSVILNLTALDIAPGDHGITVRATNSRGGFADAPPAPVVFTMDPGRSQPSTVAIEQPREGATISRTLVVTGYAYDANLRATNVDTLIDGLVYATTIYGLNRADICDPLPAPKPANCPAVGFTGTFNTLEGNPPIPDGPHQLQVRVRDQTGRFTFYPETPLTINVANGAAVPIVGVLESPVSNEQMSGTVNIAGYVYSPGRRITSATLVVDGVSMAAARIGIARPDACAGLADADACPNIGFTATFNTRILLNGPHVLGIRAVNDRGDSVTFPYLVNGGINVFVEN